MKRVLCIRFPQWPLQHLRIAQPELKDRPLILYEDAGSRGARVVICCDQSTQQGLRPGMPLAEALSLAECGAKERSDDAATRGRGEEEEGVRERGGEGGNDKIERKAHPPRRVGSVQSTPDSLNSSQAALRASS